MFGNPIEPVMRANQVVFRIGALLLVLALLCGCGKKGRLYLPPEQDSSSAHGAYGVTLINTAAPWTISTT